MEISEKALKFIQEHANDDTNALRLKYDGKNQKMDFSIDFALLQIDARKRTRKKLPSFLKNGHFVFPDSLAPEQASNEAVARYHSSLIKSGSTLLDLTAGLGIDDLTFAMSGIQVTACEIDSTKAEALRHNARVLGLEGQIQIVNTDCMDFLRNNNTHFDVVFADPARRSAAGKRLHALADCQPDILGGMEAIMKHTDHFIIKSSPLLDLTLIRKTVENLHHIIVVCFKGECKEVLIEIITDSVFTGTTTVDLDMDGVISKYICHLSPTEPIIHHAERHSPADYKYIYEPNAGVMKTGSWNELINSFPGLYKADANTHVFLSDEYFSDFPGRCLEIDKIPDKRDLKEMKGTKINVISRNYPLSAPELAKKHSLIPGSNSYLYAFRYKGKPLCLTAKLINNRMQVQE